MRIENHDTMIKVQDYLFWIAIIIIVIMFFYSMGYEYGKNRYEQAYDNMALIAENCIEGYSGCNLARVKCIQREVELRVNQTIEMIE